MKIIFVFLALFSFQWTSANAEEIVNFYKERSYIYHGDGPPNRVRGYQTPAVKRAGFFSALSRCKTESQKHDKSDPADCHIFTVLGPD